MNTELTLEEIVTLTNKLNTDMRELLRRYTDETGMAVQAFQMQHVMQDGRVVDYLIRVQANLSFEQAQGVIVDKAGKG